MTDDADPLRVDLGTMREILVSVVDDERRKRRLLPAELILLSGPALARVPTRRQCDIPPLGPLQRKVDRAGARDGSVSPGSHADAFRRRVPDVENRRERPCTGR